VRAPKAAGADFTGSLGTDGSEARGERIHRLVVKQENLAVPADPKIRLDDIHASLTRLLKSMNGILIREGHSASVGTDTEAGQPLSQARKCRPGRFLSGRLHSSEPERKAQNPAQQTNMKKSCSSVRRRVHGSSGRSAVRGSCRHGSFELI